ncbi:MAG TPA: hypothetical protein VM049_04415 [Gaiellaceae bacterium]|nr:hypothetical protein [Gaiellaceae bacterium]
MVRALARRRRRLMRDVLELLETRGGDGMLFNLAWLAGQGLEHDPEELRASLRRAALLLAAGGDPRRELEVDGRAVMAIAADLDDPNAREQLEAALNELATESEGLASVASALARLRAQPDLAWQCYAGALLAEAIGGD